MASPDADKWKTAMAIEMNSLNVNDTWDVVKLPDGKHTVGGKWVYTIKCGKNNEIEKFKARYVARGFSQISGIDYDDTFSPTAHITSIRVLIQLSVQYKLLLHQMDVSSAYLHAEIDHEIYIDQPPGFEKGEANNVCKLRKAIYGLKQSGRMWNNVINDFLTNLDFVRSEIDHCIYFKKSEDSIVYILIWVDDLIIAASDITIMNNVKAQPSSEFKMVDLGTLSWFLGIDFEITEDKITMSQSTYLKKVLSRFDMSNCKGVKTPCDKLVFDDDSRAIENILYRSAVGSLVYAMVATRPDLSYIVTKLSQYNNSQKCELLDSG